MAKAGIICEDWKLPVFRKHLDAAGFTYADGGGLMSNTTILTVNTEEVNKLGVVVRAANDECKILRRKKSK
jgi:hypothetical protein